MPLLHKKSHKRVARPASMVGRPRTLNATVESQQGVSPEDGDVVIRTEWQRDGRIYMLRNAPGPDQYLVRTREEAVTRAVTFAKRQQVRAWAIGAGRWSVLLADSR